MIELFSRYSIAVLVLIAIATGPILYSRNATLHDECASQEVFLDAQGLSPGSELITEGLRRTMIEKGKLVAFLPKKERLEAPIVYAVVRLFELPNGLLEPPSVLPGNRQPDVIESTQISTESGPIPIRYAYERNGGFIRTTAYFYAYRREAVSSALWTRVRSAPSAILGGHWPITLFTVSTQAHPAQLEQSKERLADWMRYAFSHYRRVCTGEVSGGELADAG